MESKRNLFKGLMARVDRQHSQCSIKESEGYLTSSSKEGYNIPKVKSIEITKEEPKQTRFRIGKRKDKW